MGVGENDAAKSFGRCEINGSHAVQGLLNGVYLPGAHLH